MQFSVKMRSAKGGPHEKGGRHISGAERILEEEDVEKGVVEMLRRARNHQRGKADFISIKVEEIDENQVIFKPLIPVHSCLAENIAQGHAIAKEKLKNSGVSVGAIEKGFNALLALQDSIRGAMPPVNCVVPKICIIFILWVLEAKRCQVLLLWLSLN